VYAVGVEVAQRQGMSVFVSVSPNRFLSIAAIALLLGFAHPAAADKPHSRKLDRALARVADQGGDTTRVIIRMRPGHEDAVKEALRGFKFNLKFNHPGISALTGDLRVDALDALAELDDVESVSYDAPVDGLAVTTPVPNTDGDALRATLGTTGSAYSGRGIGVAVIDSGISQLPEFNKRIKAFYDFTRGGIATQPFDDYGHGTHVAGIIAGSYPGGQDDPGRHRVERHADRAQGARWKRPRQHERCDQSRRVRYRNRVTLGINIINLSLGHVPFESATTDPLVQAVDRATAAGIVVVVAAGNVGISKGHGASGVRRHPVARQRAIRDHRWFGAHNGHGDAQRRYGRRVQLARADRGTTATRSPIWSRPAIVYWRRCRPTVNCCRPIPR
jgi:serine protease AprX